MLSLKIIAIMWVNAGVAIVGSILNYPLMMSKTLLGLQAILFLCVLLQLMREGRAETLAQQSYTTPLDKQSTIADHPNINTVAKDSGGRC